MSQYNLEPSPPSRGFSRSFLVGIFLVLLFLAIALVLLFVPSERIAFAPTATATATHAPPVTATADFGATRVAQDLATQQAVTLPGSVDGGVDSKAVAMASLTPSSPTTVTVPPDNVTVEAIPEVVYVTVTVVVLVTAPVEPDVESSQSDVQTQPVAATSTAMAVSPIDSPLDTSNTMGFPIAPRDVTPVVNTATAAPAPPTDSPLPTPLPTAIPAPVDTATLPPPTPFPTVPPTPAPTLTSTPTTVAYWVEHLLVRAIVEDLPRHIAPVSNSDAVDDDTWSTEQDITLTGRTLSGEWVYGEQDGRYGWLRQAHIRFQDEVPLNNLPDDDEDNLDVHDVRWLPLETGYQNEFEPLPRIAEIPVHDFPFLRRDYANQGRVDSLPSTPYDNHTNWNHGNYDAGSPFISPPVVAGDTVAAVNSDQHVYGISRQNGNQKAKYELDAALTTALATYDSHIYTIDVNGRVYALRSSAEIVWRQDTDMTSNVNILVVGERILVTGRANNQPQLTMLRRDTGEIIDTFTATGDDFFLPAIGDQLIYVAGSKVWALDLYHERHEPEDGESFRPWGAIWTYPVGNDRRIDPTSPPLYVLQGPTRMAELYVGSTDGNTFLLDANTGDYAEWYEGDGHPGGLAVDDQRLYVTSIDRQLRAYDRETRDKLWEQALNGRALGGPLVDGRRVLTILDNGDFTLYIAESGSWDGGYSLAQPLVGGVVSGRYIFVVSPDHHIYALEGAD